MLASHTIDQSFVRGPALQLPVAALRSADAETELHACVQHAAGYLLLDAWLCINQSINVTPVAMKLKKLMPAIH
jgi:hypothetical protein